MAGLTGASARYHLCLEATAMQCSTVLCVALTACFKS